MSACAKAGAGHQDQLGLGNGGSHIGRDQRQLHIVAAIVILDHDARSRSPMRRDLLLIAPPQPDLTSRQRKVARGGEGSIAATQHCNLQATSPRVCDCASSCFSRKCCTLPKAVRGRSVTKTMSRGIL